MTRSNMTAPIYNRPYFLTLVLGTAAMIPLAAQADQITIDSRDFMPMGAGEYIESSKGNLTCSGTGNNMFMAQVPFPPADLNIKQLAIWGGDFIAANSSARLIRYCQPEFSAGTPATTEIAEVTSLGANGNYFDAESLNIPVTDQATCVYVIQLSLGQDTCPGNDLSLARARIRYDVVQPPSSGPIFKNGFED